jgi:hypothetical protein
MGSGKIARKLLIGWDARRKPVHDAPTGAENPSGPEHDENGRPKDGDTATHST